MHIKSRKLLLIQYSALLLVLIKWSNEELEEFIAEENSWLSVKVTYRPVFHYSANTVIGGLSCSSCRQVHAWMLDASVPPFGLYADSRLLIGVSLPAWARLHTLIGISSRRVSQISICLYLAGLQPVPHRWYQGYMLRKPRMPCWYRRSLLSVAAICWGGQP